MRFFNLVTVLFTIIPICSPQVLQPEDVGIGHTKIIQDLHQLMKDKPPADRDEYFSHMVETVANNLCEPFVSFECFQRIWDSTDEIDTKFIDGFDHLSKNIVPDDFDVEVLESLKKLFFSLSLTSLNESPEYVLQLMYEDFIDLKNNDKTMNEEDRMIGLVAYSVGMESTKQWHEILNDPENQFSKMINAQKEINRRQLQEEQERERPYYIHGSFNKVLEAGVVGSAVGVISGTPDRILENNNTALDQALESASLYSATNIFGVIEWHNNANGTSGGLISNVIDGVFGSNDKNETDSGIAGGENNSTEHGFIDDVVDENVGNKERNITGAELIGNVIDGIIGIRNNSGTGDGFISNVVGGIIASSNKNETESGPFGDVVENLFTSNNENDTDGGNGIISNVLDSISERNNNRTNGNFISNVLDFVSGNDNGDGDGDGIGEGEGGIFGGVFSGDNGNSDNGDGEGGIISNFFGRFRGGS